MAVGSVSEAARKRNDNWPDQPVAYCKSCRSFLFCIKTPKPFRSESPDSGNLKDCKQAMNKVMCFLSLQMCLYMIFICDRQ